MNFKNNFLLFINIIAILIILATFKVSLDRNLSPDGQLVLALQSELGYLKHQVAQSGIEFSPKSDNLPLIFVITPTYKKPEQKAELTRLCQVLVMVPNVVWLVVEDAEAKSRLVANFLQGCGVHYAHLSAPTSMKWKLKPGEGRWTKPRGVEQRNAGIDWIRVNVRGGENGVVYFADDDNTYSLELFEEMRYTERVSVWPVGLVGGVSVEKPRVDPESGKVVGWDVIFGPNRKFAVDMAGFAVNLRLLLSKPEAKFSYDAGLGLLEPHFLGQIITNITELEPKANLCTKVLVWHTRTSKPNLALDSKLKKKNKGITIEV